MTFFDWLPAILTSSTVAVAGWIARKLLETRLTRSVQHEFDLKLEAIRGDLRAKEAQLAALRSGAMAGLASRQIALDAKRIAAAEEIWAAVVTLAPAKNIATMMKGIRFDEALKHGGPGSSVQGMFNELDKVFATGPMRTTEAWKMRPFISPMVWALFVAYQGVVGLAVAKLQMLKSGVDQAQLLNTDGVEALIRAALPHQAAFIAEHGHDVTPFLLEELESRLLSEIQTMMAGGDSDIANVTRAAEILRASDRVAAEEGALRREVGDV